MLHENNSSVIYQGPFDNKISISSGKITRVILARILKRNVARERRDSPLLDINPRGVAAITTTIYSPPASGTAISDFGASLFIINPFAIGLGRVSSTAALFCVKPINLDHARPSGSSTAASRWRSEGCPGRGGNIEHMRGNKGCQREERGGGGVDEEAGKRKTGKIREEKRCCTTSQV